MKSTAIYVRVSTTDQDPQMQVEECTRFAEFRKWGNVELYTDHGVSGTKTTRPELERMLKDVRRGKVARVVVWKIDRLGRNAAHVCATVEELAKLNVDFHSITESFDTSTALGRAITTMLAAMAQLERDNNAERTRAGIAQARRNGKQVGRPRVDCTPGEVARLVQSGLTNRAIASQLKVSAGTVAGARKRAQERGLL